MFRFRAFGCAAAFFLFSISQACAGDKVSASFTWTSPQLASLAVSRDQKPITLKDKRVELVFTDPRNKSEIEKILLDKEYRPGDASAPDFFLQTTITSPISRKKVSETSACYWNGDPSRVHPKSVAICSIEDDGGRLALVTENRSASLAASQFALFVLDLDGYTGFRIADDKPVGNETNEPHPISVKLKNRTPIRAPIKF